MTPNTAATRIAGIRTYIPAQSARTTDGDLDLIAVERAVNGELPADMTDAELARADQILSTRDLPRSEAARRLGLPSDLLRELRAADWKPEVITSWRTNTRGAAA
ncbi:hypothetical protein [Streptomyces sasae]|uniref:hypothetical protein n=1 Tax=Streptomyces sasae TaxID=1266772 RepID=UPI002930DB90|nr:hypothetical protein [Streptomyces sasae]